MEILAQNLPPCLFGSFYRPRRQDIRFARGVPGVLLTFPSRRSRGCSTWRTLGIDLRLGFMDAIWTLTLLESPAAAVIPEMVTQHLPTVSRRLPFSFTIAFALAPPCRHLDLYLLWSCRCWLLQVPPPPSVPSVQRASGHWFSLPQPSGSP